MNAQTKSLFLISLICNLLFMGLFSWLIIRKGGFSYLANQISLMMQDYKKSGSSSSINSNFSVYYEMKKRQFEVLPNSDREIIFLGDSLTDQAEWAELLNNPHIKNRGISGDTTEGVLARLDEIVESKPKQIFLMIGTNDIWNAGKTVGQVTQNYKLIIETIKQRSPSTQVFVQSLLPVNNQDYRIKVNNNDLVRINRQIEEFAKQFSYQYIDLYNSFINKQNQLDPKYTFDGVHLNEQGYLTWKRIIESDIADTI
ncbi:MAG TPA: G-D-S-L family lipolytic protein [Cyanobacteria bacterium UBA11162]|nr:G-D-S-L family lipolytic protein [Cyanobacteria bacterium UBA11162]